MDLATLVHEAESAVLPSGDAERFAGYGVMGLPFASGHVLAIGRFPASSTGPGYSSVWHRTPSGVWTFSAAQVADQDCTRYFSAAVPTVTETETEIVVEWPGPDELRVRVPASDLDWRRPGPLSPQAILGDFTIPQQGVFAVGRAFFR